MFSKILGIVWVCLGLLWVFKPRVFKARLEKKMSRKVKRIVFGFMLILSFTMIGSVIKVPGIIAKIVGVIGMFIAIKAIMAITSKTSENVFEWWGKKPLTVFRILGAVVFSIGVLILLV